MRIEDLFLWFILYSFVGWAYESLLFTIKDRRPVNRGFLNGPVCPVYGCGAILLIVALDGRTNNVFVLFFAALVLTTSVEYLTAVIMENLFHAKWWDYANFPLNFQGRISLPSSFVFAVMSVLMIEYIQPFVAGLTGRIPEDVKAYIILAVLLIFLPDMIVTVRHVFVLNGRLREIQTALNGFISNNLRRAEEVKNTLRTSFEESEFYSERIKILFRLGRIQNARLFKAFPRLRSTAYDDAMKKMKDRILVRRSSGEDKNEK